MPLNGVDHVGFTVTDLDRTTAWYCRHLDFEPLVRYTNSEIGAEVQVLRHADMSARLSFRRFDAGNNEAFSEFRVGLDHFALRVADESDLGEWPAGSKVRELRAAALISGAVDSRVPGPGQHSDRVVHRHQPRDRQGVGSVDPVTGRINIKGEVEARLAYRSARHARAWLPATGRLSSRAWRPAPKCRSGLAVPVDEDFRQWSLGWSGEVYSCDVHHLSPEPGSELGACRWRDRRTLSRYPLRTTPE